MKAFTDIEQSKKLAEILPIESADMRYGYIAPYEFSDRMYDGGYDDIPYLKDFMKKNPNFSEDEYDGEFPCWSLAALLSVLPEYIKFDGHTWKFYNDHCGTYYMNVDTYDTYTFSANNKNLVDACYELILKLHEQDITVHHPLNSNLHTFFKYCYEDERSDVAEWGDTLKLYDDKYNIANQ